jgi:hypothetical protein
MPLVNYSPYVFSHFAPLLLDLDFDLSENQVPILAVLMQNDELIDLQKSTAVLGRIPNLRIKILSDFGHDIYYLNLEQEDRLISELNL